jgi:hypothetical protein
MVCVRWLTLGVFCVLVTSCGGPAPSETTPAVRSRPLAMSCDIARGDEDCDEPGTSALNCRTREGAQRGICVDDFANLCAGLGGPETAACMFDQHCAGWEHGWTMCTDFGSLGPPGCGVCREP